MLVNLFAKQYDPSTCATDPGVPFVEKPETVVFEKYERASVEEVYKRIEADLLEAMALVEDDMYTVPKYHFTKAALYAFASRLYLYKGEWDKVIEYSSKLLGENPASKLRDWNGKYANYEAKELWAQYSKPEESANILLNRAYTVWAQGLVVFRYSLSAEKAVELFELGNVGLKNFSTVIGDKILQAGGSDQCSFIPKYQDRIETEGNVDYGIPNTIIPLFTMEEALFNRAEAYAMTGQFDKALDDIDFYYQKRMQGYEPLVKKTEEDLRDVYTGGNVELADLSAFYPVSDRQRLYISYLLDLRRREFIHEGMRWFDIRRYNLPVVHKTFDGEVLVLPKDDPRRLIQIPNQAVSAGVAPNPR